MKFFELHFNPQKGYSADAVFDSFCYEPENALERRLGSLFIVGELKNLLPSNSQLLDTTAAFIKKSYYSAPAKSSPETALKEALKKTNEFLEGVAKQGDVSWLGNLNLAVFNAESQKKGKFLANFAKVGNVKILLLRPGQVIDIGKNLELSEIEPYPLKIFGNIISGKLAQEDLITILTNGVFEHFSEQGILKQIAGILPFSNSELKKVLRAREKELKKISGVCLLCVLTQELPNQVKEPKLALTFKKDAEKFRPFKTLISAWKRFQKNVSKRPAAKIKQLRIAIKHLWVRKNIILILLLALLLVLGFLLF